MLTVSRLVLGATLALASHALLADPADKPERIRVEHETRQIEGWTVHVDTSLLEGEHKELGEQSLRYLAQRLHQIVLRIPSEPVKRMQEVPIYFDRNHPLGNAHFHPSAKWLDEHGYDPAMTKAIHITHAKSLVNEAKRRAATSVLLHELAHAYHDRVLGFDDKAILEGYKQFCDSRNFDLVPTLGGTRRPHYGLTDHKEYFAEITETFFVGNSFYPFNHVDLLKIDPASHALMAKIWGVDVEQLLNPKKDALSAHDLRILATLNAQRGDYEEAYQWLDKADERSPGNERFAAERKRIEEEQAKRQPSAQD